MASNKSRLILSIILLLGAFVVAVATGKPACTHVYVDYGSLKNQVIQSCVSTVETENALSVVLAAGFDIAGTDKYGLGVVCRVNGLPDKSHESCAKMPSEKAYWALLVKRRAIIPNPFDVNSKWNWAPVGIMDLKVKPGDSVGLVFANNGKVKFP